jgi:hypothetical protein
VSFVKPSTEFAGVEDVYIVFNYYALSVHRQGLEEDISRAIRKRLILERSECDAYHPPQCECTLRTNPNVRCMRFIGWKKELGAMKVRINEETVSKTCPK